MKRLLFPVITLFIVELFAFTSQAQAQSYSPPNRGTPDSPCAQYTPGDRGIPGDLCQSYTPPNRGTPGRRQTGGTR
jgi:hypothetical protein